MQLSDGDVDVLTHYAKELKQPNCYLEIGSAEGGSACIAYEAASKDIEIHAIDDQQRWEFKGPRDKIHFHRGTSQEYQRSWNQPIGVLFIDADHDSAGADFMYWNRFVAKGGIILFHDYKNGSLKVDEDCDFLFNGNPKFEILHYEPSNEFKSHIYQVKKL
jgi:predicted O-methyltransferase YrrM